MNREKLFEENQGLVHEVISRGGYPREFLNAGFLGLFKAAQKYDGRNKFSTYAIPMIRGYILNEIRDMRRPACKPYFEEDYASDIETAPEIVERLDLIEYVKKRMADLNINEKLVLTMRHLEGLTLAQAGNHLGLSIEGARKLQERAERRLRILCA